MQTEAFTAAREAADLLGLGAFPLERGASRSSNARSTARADLSQSNWETQRRAAAACLRRRGLSFSSVAISAAIASGCGPVNVTTPLGNTARVLSPSISTTGRPHAIISCGTRE